jgi:DNA-directed RNA polymerase subunit RPC12/RpoP
MTVVVVVVVVARVRCPRCGYEWETRSAKLYVTCPNCLRKVRVTTAATTTTINTTTTASPLAPSTTTTTTTTATTTLNIAEVSALLDGVETVALVNGVPAAFGQEAERRGFIAYQLAAPRPDDSAWLVVKGSFADYVLHVWTALHETSKEEVLEAARNLVRRGLRRDVRRLVVDDEDEAARIALYALTERGLVDWGSGRPEPAARWVAAPS